MEDAQLDVPLIIMGINGIAAGYFAGASGGKGRVLISNLVIGVVCSFTCGVLMQGGLNLFHRPRAFFMLHLLVATICTSIFMGIARFVDR